MLFDQLGIIGCGLMGGSFALAARRAGLAQRIVGHSATRASAEAALARGAIDTIADTAAEAAQGADLVLVSVPVAATEGVLRDIRVALGADTLVMDVGSTKADVARAALRALGNRADRFVPAHPMAGKESAGVAHAEASLYDGRQVILAPLPQNDAALVARAAGVWQTLGAAAVRTMTPDEHDRAIASVSHLPHLIAFAYLEGLLAETGGRERMALGGPGFRDFTRIAAGDATMWRDVLLANRDEVLAQSRRFRAVLERLEALVERGDGPALHDTIRAGAEVRAGWQLGARAE